MLSASVPGRARDRAEFQRSVWLSLPICVFVLVLDTCIVCSPRYAFKFHALTAPRIRLMSVRAPESKTRAGPHLRALSAPRPPTSPRPLRS